MNPWHRETLANILERLSIPIAILHNRDILYRYNSVFGVRSQNSERLSEASVAGMLGTAGYLLRAASSVPSLPEKHVPHSEHKGGVVTPPSLRHPHQKR